MPGPEIPIDWTARVFQPERYGYSIRYLGDWSAREATAPGRPDRLGPTGSALPYVTVAARDLAPGTTAERWSVLVESVPGVDCSYDWYRRISVDGEPGRVAKYRSCNGTAQQWASFVHGGRGCRVVWRGKVGTNHAASPLFDATLNTIAFSP